MDLTERFPNVIFYGPCIIKPNVQIGDGTRIGEYSIISNNARIGKNCRILYHVTICKDAVIGHNVFIGPKTTFLNDKYPPSKTSNPPLVGDNVVIGGNCLLLPGIKIGENSKVGAGCRVVKDIPKNTEWLIENLEYNLV